MNLSIRHGADQRNVKLCLLSGSLVKAYHFVSVFEGNPELYFSELMDDLRRISEPADFEALQWALVYENSSYAVQMDYGVALDFDLLPSDLSVELTKRFQFAWIEHALSH